MMPELPSARSVTADIAGARQDEPRLPQWRDAMEGMWLFTWKTNLTWRRLPVLLASLLLVPLLAYFTLKDGASRPYFLWTVDFYLVVLVPLYCLFICGAMMRDEIQGDTISFLLTRPLTRAELFLLKYLCQVIWLEMMGAVVALLLIFVGWWYQIPDLNQFALLFLSTQLLAILAYGALSALFGLVHQRYMVLGIIYGFVVELGIGKIPTNINSLSLSHHMQTLLANSLAINQYYSWTPEGTLYSQGVMLLATGIFLSMGLLLFTFKEYHHSDEMQK